MMFFFYEVLLVYDSVIGVYANTQCKSDAECTYKRRLEEGLWTTESFVSDGDHLSIRQLIALFQRGGGSSCSHLILKVQCHIA